MVDNAPAPVGAADEGAGNAPVAEDGKYDPTTFKAGETRTVRLRVGGHAEEVQAEIATISAAPGYLFAVHPDLDDASVTDVSELTTGLRISKSDEGRDFALFKAKGNIERLDSTTSKGAVERSGPVASLPLEKRANENRKTRCRIGKPENRIGKPENRKTESEAPAQKHKPVSSEQFATFEQQKSSQDRWRSGCNQGPARRNRVDRSQAMAYP